MPNYYDFSTLNEIKELEIYPHEWINPLIIEYGINLNISGNTYFWRVKGTGHTFSILTQRMNYLSSGDYGQHFIEVLQTFREDYLEWKKQNFECKWMQEYRDEYSRFIL